MSTAIGCTGVLTLVVSMAAAGDALAQGRNASIRFADMDSNSDGVITRREWRGSDRSFEVHDWNRDGILSGDEVRPGAQRRSEDRTRERAEPNQPYADWTANGFTALDHNRDGRISRDEWHFDLETFRRADHDGNGSLSRPEFLGEDKADDDREDRFDYLDANNDGRLARAEWHGTAERFDALDGNRDGVLTRREMLGGDEPPTDLFTSVDINRDNRIGRDEWHWSRFSFDSRDSNKDGVLTRQEFSRGETQQARSEAWRQGYARGLADGRQAGKEDKQLRNAWDLDGQRELETADSGYEARWGARADYQAGYREAFRIGDREGFGPR